MHFLDHGFRWSDQRIPFLMHPQSYSVVLVQNGSFHLKQLFRYCCYRLRRPQGPRQSRHRTSASSAIVASGTCRPRKLNCRWKIPDEVVFWFEDRSHLVHPVPEMHVAARHTVQYLEMPPLWWIVEHLCLPKRKDHRYQNVCLETKVPPSLLWSKYGVLFRQSLDDMLRR